MIAGLLCLVLGEIKVLFVATRVEAGDRGKAGTGQPGLARIPGLHVSLNTREGFHRWSNRKAFEEKRLCGDSNKPNFVWSGYDVVWVKFGRNEMSDGKRIRFLLFDKRCSKVDIL